MAPARSKLGLSRSRRIRESGEFRGLRERGHRRAYGCLLANWECVPGAVVSRVGVIASKKVGPAVVRNRAKRLLREAFRLHQHEFAQPVNVVLVARHSIVGVGLRQVEQDLLGALRRVGVREV